MLLPLLMNNMMETPAPPIIEVCTAGQWSATIPFVVCDDYNITIDGPAADDVQVSATIELQE